MLKLHSLGSLIMTGLILAGLFTVPSATTPPQNQALTVPDVIFYGNATIEGEVLESGIIKALLPRGGRVTAEIAPIPGTDYNYALAVPLNTFDDLESATLPEDAVVSQDTLYFTINDSKAYYQDASGMDVRAFTIPENAIGQTYILDLMISSPDDYMMGDVNVNGYRDVADALLMLRYSVGFAAGDEDFPPATGKPYLPLCDIVVDKTCNASDALRILQCDVGLPSVPCLPSPPSPITLTQNLDVSLVFRLEVVPSSGGRTVRVIAEDYEPRLGAASLELHYDTENLSLTNCAAAPITEMNAGVCYAAPGTSSARLNYVAVNGIQPGVVVGELSFAPVGDYNMAQLAEDLELEIKGAFDLEGEAFVWPETFTSLVNKSVSPVLAAPGEPISYTISFSNTGTAATPDIIITDTLSAKITNASFSSRGVNLTQVPGSRYVWTAPGLSPGTGGSIFITGVLSKPLTAGTLVNEVTLLISGTLQTDKVNLIVKNVAPVADAGIDQSVSVSSTVTLDGRGTDDNGDPLAYGWTQTGGLTVTLSSTSVKAPHFIAPATSSLLTFTLSVTDTQGLADTDTVVVEAIAGIPSYVSSPPVGSDIPFLGDVKVGEMVTATLAISNTGTAALNITSVNITGTDTAGFSVVPQTLSIPEGGPAQNLYIRCMPSGVNAQVVTLTVEHNAPDTPATYPLHCPSLIRTIYLPVLFK